MNDFSIEFYGRKGNFSIGFYEKKDDFSLMGKNWVDLSGTSVRGIDQKVVL